MAQLIVRNLDQKVKNRLQRRAKKHGRSMEEEVREILRDATKDDKQPRQGLGTQIADLFKDCGLGPGEELERLPDVYLEPMDFEE